MPKADIVISHNSPYGIHDIPGDDAHEGFIGLINYVRTYQPKYLFHGHQHKNIETNELNTKIVGIYGAVIFDTETGNKEIIYEY